MHLSLPHPRRSPERRRRLLASGILRLIDEAERPSTPFSPAVPVQRQAILSSRTRLLGLAEALADTGEPVNDRGIALVDELLRDGASPVYSPLGEAALDAAVRHAHAALMLGAEA
jgi:hypothetical protein